MSNDKDSSNSSNDFREKGSDRIEPTKPSGEPSQGDIIKGNNFPTFQNPPPPPPDQKPSSEDKK